MIYTNVSAVGATTLAEDLTLLGPRYANGVIVTQVVPAVSGYSALFSNTKNALAKYFPGEAPDYSSLEGYISANVLIQALKRAGPQFDTEKLVDVLENTSNLDLGLGTALNFGRGEHQASHKVWGTALDEGGKYQAVEFGITSATVTGTGNSGTEDVLPSNKKNTTAVSTAMEYSLGYPLLVLCFALVARAQRPSDKANIVRDPCRPRRTDSWFGVGLPGPSRAPVFSSSSISSRR